MDNFRTFRWFVGRLTFSVLALVVFVVGLFSAPRAVYAQQIGGIQSYASAQAACAAAVSAQQPAYSKIGVTLSCSIEQLTGYSPPDCAELERRSDNGSALQAWNFVCSGAQNPCSSLTSFSTTISVASGQTLGSVGATQEQDPVSGGYVSCPYSLSYSNGGQCVVNSSGACTVTATATYSGNPLSTNETSSPSTPAGTPEYQTPSGALATPQPNTSSSAPPVVCGGQSCFDPETLQFCGVDGGGQFCEPLSTAETNQGGCSSIGGSTLCAGSPTPPSPLGTPGTTVTNPPTQIAGMDTYPTGNVSSGSTGTIGVSVYNGPGSSSSSGAPPSAVKTGGKSSSSSPASSSTSSTAEGFGAGQDCNTPPQCSGDAVLCGIAMQNWTSFCYQNSLLVGAGMQQPPTFSADQTKYSVSDITVQPSSGNTVGDQANQGTYDQSGFGYSTSCPGVDQPVSVGVGTVVLPFSKLCVIGPWVYWTVIGFSLFAAMRITAGSRG